MEKRTCSIGGCGKPHYGNGWCQAHWHRNRRYGDPLGGGPMRQPPRECSVEACTERAIAKGLCRAHYYRLYNHGDLRPDDPIAPGRRGPRGNRTCSVAGCDSKHYGRGYCLRHYQRWKQYGNAEEPFRRALAGESTNRWVNNDGYVLIRLRGKSVLEHRHIMEGILGRPMLPEETVHHKNGVRTDNRPENLELWVSTRSGQRVTDLIAFMVEHYRSDVEAALRS